MSKPQKPEIKTPFRLHYSDGTTADITATSAQAARDMGQREGVKIDKTKVIKERT
jgi:hypothetical protein